MQWTQLQNMNMAFDWRNKSHITHIDASVGVHDP